MKRWITVAALLGLVLMSTAAVWAGPTDVGGNFSTFESVEKTQGPAVYKGKGNPQGNPFQVVDTNLLLAPTDVGGN